MQSQTIWSSNRTVTNGTTLYRRMPFLGATTTTTTSVITSTSIGRQCQCQVEGRPRRRRHQARSSSSSSSSSLATTAAAARLAPKKCLLRAPLARLGLGAVCLRLVWRGVNGGGEAVGGGWTREAAGGGRIENGCRVAGASPYQQHHQALAHRRLRRHQAAQRPTSPRGAAPGRLVGLFKHTKFLLVLVLVVVLISGDDDVCCSVLSRPTHRPPPGVPPGENVSSLLPQHHLQIVQGQQFLPGAGPRR
ncbi:hypothetical protein niasHT_024591 [Heterodera trifolii]|uniref:Uncharacterized protein n=1 Tax=Heterodera trifolii TaxID=157864 RepID=A0ABD2K7F9_9BILA